MIRNQYSYTHLPFSIKKIFNIIQRVLCWKSFLQNKQDALRSKALLGIEPPCVNEAVCSIGGKYQNRSTLQENIERSNV